MVQIDKQRINMEEIVNKATYDTAFALFVTYRLLRVQGQHLFSSLQTFNAYKVSSCTRKEANFDLHFCARSSSRCSVFHYTYIFRPLKFCFGVLLRCSYPAFLKAGRFLIISEYDYGAFFQFTYPLFSLGNILTLSATGTAFFIIYILSF